MKVEDQKLKDSVNEELVGHLMAKNSKMELIGTTFNMLQIIKEAVYMMAINRIISDRQLADEGLSHLSIDNTTELIFEFVEELLNRCFPDVFNSSHMKMVKNDYFSLINNENKIILINKHYQELYDTNKHFI